MGLLITGRPTGAGVRQSILRDAYEYMTDLLMIEDIDRKQTIEVEIHLVQNFKDQYDQIAECNWLDDRLRPNKFYIDLDADLSHKSILITLGHELTHIKQMAFCQRQESLTGNGMRWLGSLYYPDQMHYYDLPWEIEAHGREFGLYDRFINRESLALPPATIIDESKRIRVIAAAA